MNSRTRIVTQLMLGIAAVALPSQSVAAQATRLVVTAVNPLAMERRDETIALPWSQVTAALPTATKDRVRVRDGANGAELASQPIDDNGDGTIDHLLFQANFWSKESKSFVVEPIAAIAAKHRTYVYHDEPRDDIAWESDKLAWRIYGQGLKKTSSAMSSSGVDIWVKKTRDLVVDKWYKKGHDAYHVDDGEGADFYDVGETLGAGGTALWVNDSLIRADNFTQYKIVAMGPVRAIFEVQYPEWTAGTLKVSQTKRVIVDAGSNLYREESIFRAPAGTKEIPYVIGELKRAGMVGTMSRTNSWAWLTGWGPTTPKKGGDGEIGTAVLLPRDRVRDWKETKDHYLAVTSATPNVPVVHYAGAGWTLSGEFRDVRDWWRYLDEFALKLATPIKVTVGGDAK